MVLDDIGEFIRRQRESLEVEKRDFHKEVSQESVRKRISCNVQEPDQNVPTIGLSPEPKHVYDAEPVRINNVGTFIHKFASSLTHPLSVDLQ